MFFAACLRSDFYVEMYDNFRMACRNNPAIETAEKVETKFVAVAQGDHTGSERTLLQTKQEARSGAFMLSWNLYTLILVTL